MYNHKTDVFCADCNVMQWEISSPRSPNDKLYCGYYSNVLLSHANQYALCRPVQLNGIQSSVYS